MGQPIAKIPRGDVNGPNYYYTPRPNQQIENMEIYMGDQALPPRGHQYPPGNILNGPSIARGPQRAGGREFWQEDPVYLPGMEPQPRRGLKERFDPFDYERDMRPAPMSRTSNRGLAGDIIENMRTQPRQQVIEPGRVTQYRCPPGGCKAQPRILKQTTVVNEPRGYMPPNNGQPNINFGNPPNFLSQQSANPQNVMYYDPNSGALSGGMGNQMMGFPQQQPQMGQPIVIPGSLYNPASGVQKI